MTEELSERDRRAANIRRESAARSGQTPPPWESIDEAERERWRRTVGKQPKRPGPIERTLARGVERINDWLERWLGRPRTTFTNPRFDGGNSGVRLTAGSSERVRVEREPLRNRTVPPE